MADAWLPDAGRMPARHDGGALQGGAPRVVWCASETDPQGVSARSVAADLLKEGSPPHLVWHPGSGDIVQLLPLTRAGRLLGVAAAREGRTCLQIAVVAQARVPFTGAVLLGLDPLMRWLDDWNVPRRWPAGPPLPSPQSYHSQRSRKDWARGGHYGASQVPGADRLDPGALDIRRITGPDTPVAAIPRPRHVPGMDPAPATVPPARLTPLTADPLRTPEAVPAVPPVPIAN
ncbi:hypothetical protein [Spirillospora albida]|uniref:hypothetical protein n=1 Tax=Spirillospora albida TaxID=58123 RepID=UPI0004BFC0BD|nr:hypothetical protein [Spirillospora albida]